MTVKELWDVTTCEIQIIKRRPGVVHCTRLPDGGRLQIEDAELRVKRILTEKFSMESVPHMIVETEEET